MYIAFNTLCILTSSFLLHISNRNLSKNKISLLRNGSFYGLAALEKLWVPESKSLYLFVLPTVLRAVITGAVSLCHWLKKQNGGHVENKEILIRVHSAGEPSFHFTTFSSVCCLASGPTFRIIMPNVHCYSGFFWKLSSTLRWDRIKDKNSKWVDVI